MSAPAVRCAHALAAAWQVTGDNAAAVRVRVPRGDSIVLPRDALLC